MEINRLRLETSITRKTGEKIWKTFAERYQPLIHGVRNTLREKMGLNSMESAALFQEEMFLTDTGQILYYRIIDNQSKIEIGSLIATQEESDTFSQFRDSIGKTVKSKKSSGLIWLPVIDKNTTYEMIKEEALILEPDTAEMDASSLLKDEKLRKLLRKISRKGACFQEELVKGPDDYETPQLVNALEAMGLITKEFYVFCLESGQQISRVGTLQALQESRAHGVKCFSCGRLLSEERISPRLKATHLGEKFSQSNYWLALYLAYTMRNTGAAVDTLYFSTEKDGNVFNLFTKAFDSYIMFEVKDDPVKLEDIFMFLSRVSYYRPFRAILLSSHKVPVEVRLYLRNYKQFPITLVEGIDNLEQAIRDSFQQKQEDYVENIFSDFTKSTEIALDALFLEKLYHPGTVSAWKGKTGKEGGDSQTEDVPEDAYDSEEVEMQDSRARTLTSDTIEVTVAEEDEDSLAEPTIELEMIETSTTDAYPAEDEHELVEVEAHGEDYSYADESTRQYTIPQSDESVVTDISDDEFDIETEDQEHPRSDGEEMGKPTLTFDSEYSMDFDEALPTEILPSEEIPIEADTSEEDLERAANFILDFVAGEGVHGNISRIEPELAYVQDVSSFKAGLIDKSGLMIVHNLPNNVNIDEFAAYSVSVFESISQLVNESGHGITRSIHLDGTSGRVKIFVGETTYLSAWEEKKTSEYEEDAGALPGETTLREAILSKVLEDLAHTEGIKGAIVAGPDGLIIEANIPTGEFDTDTLGYLSGQVINENEKYMELLGIGRITQILIKTKSNYFNLLPIDQEAILTACLDPQVPREVWHSQLPQAAHMIKSVM